MSLTDSKGALSRAVKDLLARWSTMQGVWSDTQSQEFEDVYLRQIEQDARSTLSAMDHMSQILQTIEHDCE